MSESVLWFKPLEARLFVISSTLATISFLSIVTLFVLLVWTSVKRRGSAKRTFLKTQIGAYVLSLMAADSLNSIITMMSFRWIAELHASSGWYCTTQAVLSHFSNVSMALWTAIIAIHTLRVLVFDLQTSNKLCYTTLVVTWLIPALIVVLSRTVIQTPERGDFYGVAGHCCLITDQYKKEDFFVESIFMLATAPISVIMYTLVFFRMRGNLIAVGWRLHIVTSRSSKEWKQMVARAVIDADTIKTAWRMMWYPLLYMLTVLPMIILFSASLPLNQTSFVAVFVNVLFQLNGLGNTILFFTTRRFLPPIKLRRTPALNVSIPTQQISFANETLAFAAPHSEFPMVHLETQTSALGSSMQAASVVEKSHRRVSEESTKTSFLTQIKDEGHESIV